MRQRSSPAWAETPARLRRAASKTRDRAWPDHREGAADAPARGHKHGDHESLGTKLLARPGRRLRDYDLIPMPKPETLSHDRPTVLADRSAATFRPKLGGER